MKIKELLKKREREALFAPSITPKRSSARSAIADIGNNAEFQTAKLRWETVVKTDQSAAAQCRVQPDHQRLPKR